MFRGIDYCCENQQNATRILSQRRDLLDVFENVRLDIRAASKVGNAQNPEILLENLQYYWSQHNDLCNQIDEELENDISEKSIKLYEQIVPIDQEKRRLSRLIKPSIEKYIDQTPSLSFSSFWINYAHDHKHLDDRTLRKKYHRGAQWLLERRRETDPLTKIEMEQKPTYEQPKNAVEELLVLDNFTEYVWMKNLIGLPDYLLREQLATTATRRLNKQVSIMDHENIIRGNT